jgi:hypothetical protein
MAISLIFYLLSASSVFASNDCTCPKVPASGQGNTSCSASEANNRCTVDYNVFFERETRSVQFLSKLGIGSLKPPDPALNSFDAFLRLRGRDQEVTDAVLVYLMVALSAQPSASDLAPAAKIIADVVRSPNLSSRIIKAFDYQDTGSAGSDESLLRSPPSNAVLEDFAALGSAKGRIVSGCVEFYVRDVWVMFKAAWSPYRLQPRCGQ